LVMWFVKKTALKDPYRPARSSSRQTSPNNFPLFLQIITLYLEKGISRRGRLGRKNSPFIGHISCFDHCVLILSSLASFILGFFSTHLFGHGFRRLASFPFSAWWNYFGPFSNPRWSWTCGLIFPYEKACSTIPQLPLGGPFFIFPPERVNAPPHFLFFLFDSMLAAEPGPADLDLLQPIYFAIPLGLP